jgi:hypothetical protein
VEDSNVGEAKRRKMAAAEGYVEQERPVRSAGKARRLTPPDGISDFGIHTWNTGDRSALYCIGFVAKTIAGAGAFRRVSGILHADDKTYFFRG